MFHSQIQKLNSTERLHNHPIIIIATCETLEKFPTGLLSCFRHEIQLESPNEITRLAILDGLTKFTNLAPDVQMSSIAAETAALVSKDLVDLIGRAGSLALKRGAKLEEGNGVGDKAVKAGTQVYNLDFEEALGNSRAQYSDSIGAPKVKSSLVFLKFKI